MQSPQNTHSLWSLWEQSLDFRVPKPFFSPGLGTEECRYTSLLVQKKDSIPLFKVIVWCSWGSLPFHAYCKDKDMPYKSIIPASHSRCPLPLWLPVLPATITSLSSLAMECHGSTAQKILLSFTPHSLNMWIWMWNLLMSCPFMDITNYVSKAWRRMFHRGEVSRFICQHTESGAHHSHIRPLAVGD